jgi:RNA polymerase-binding transcription factor DksA
MDGIRKRLEQDLRAAVGRLRQVGGATALEDLLGPRGEHWSYADEVDEIQANERREIGFATRELLVERVNRITAALDRLNDGEYGICIECGEKIAAARLRALPEVQTCVRCQDMLERRGRQHELEPIEVEAGADDD